MNLIGNKGTGSPGSSIGNRITAKRAGQLACVRLSQVVDLCQQKRIFGIHADGVWWVSRAVLSELRALVLPSPGRRPGVPEIFAGGVR